MQIKAIRYTSLMLNMIGKIKKSIKNHLNFPSTENTLSRLKRLGFKPNSVFDIGAYRGEFAQMCFKYWPDTEVTCFEVLPEKVKELHKLSSKYRIIVQETLVGERDSADTPFHLAETASSILKEHQDNHFPVSTFPMITLNSFCRQNKKIPQLIKIDTQGYEYEVLYGSLEILDNIEFILAELNLIDIHKGVRLATDVINLLDEKEFVPFDVSELHRRPLDSALWQIDLLFCKKNSVYRSDKRWGA